MPIYEYVCSNCKTKFEVMRPMSQADQPAPCELCHSKKTRRAVSLFAASSGGKPVSGTTASGCGGCSGGSCSHCGSAN